MSTPPKALSTDNAAASTTTTITPNGNTAATTSTTTTNSNGISNANGNSNGNGSAPSSDGTPPRKRLKVADAEVPRYNSHNIYSRPPVVDSAAVASLPVIVPPVSPLDADCLGSDGEAKGDGLSLDFLVQCTVAPLPSASEEWPLCALCQKGGDLSRCSSCRQSYYCNRDCQVAHWDVHCIVCQPGPPQPAALPKGGQKVAPPTTITRHHLAAANSGYAAPNGYSNHTPARRPRGRPRGSTNSKKKARTPRKRHLPASNGQYVCPHCSREFSSGNALGGHISGAHTKKARRLAEQRAAYEALQRGQPPYAGDPAGYRYPAAHQPPTGAAGMY